MECRTERDQRRRGVADRRAVGDVAADGADVADRRRGEAADQFAEIRIVTGKDGLGLAVGDAGADLDGPAAVVEPAQFADAADPHQGRKLAHVFGDPQADIGRSRDNGRLRVGEEDLGERIGGGGGVKSAALVADPDGLLVLQCVQPCQRIRCAPIELVGGRLRAGMLGGPHDRRVAGAAAEIAGQRIVDRLFAGCVAAGLAEREQRHHETGRAEAALRAMMIDHRGLHGMQGPIVVFQMLDSEKLAAVEGADRLDAGIDGAVDQPAVLRPHHHHGARAAIALVAALLGSDMALGEPQPIEHRRGRGDAVDLSEFITEQETNAWSHVSPPSGINCPGRCCSHRERSAAARGSARPRRRCRSGSGYRREKPAPAGRRARGADTRRRERRAHSAPVPWCCRPAAAHHSVRRDWSGCRRGQCGRRHRDGTEQCAGPPPGVRWRCRVHASSGVHHRAG